MKKIFFAFSLILLFSFLVVFQVFAQEGIVIPTAEPVVKNVSVDYNLPYAGLLPDSSLYFFKITRDRIIDFLISDPLKKAEFYLLQGDKRLSSGMSLVAKDKSKTILAQSTISKGENYFEKAIGKVREAQKQGMDIKDMKRQLLESSRKHQEILKSLNFTTLEKRAANFEKQVKLIMPQ